MADEDDKEPPLNSAEWFTWVEGKYLGTDYDEKPAPQPRAPDWFSEMLRARHPDLTDAEIYAIFTSH